MRILPPRKPGTLDGEKAKSFNQFRQNSAGLTKRGVIMPETAPISPVMAKLSESDMTAVRAAVARAQEDILVHGGSVYYSEDGVLFELRPDGSKHKVTGPIEIDCVAPFKHSPAR